MYIDGGARLYGEYRIIGKFANRTRAFNSTERTGGLEYRAGGDPEVIRRKV